MNAPRSVSTGGAKAGEATGVTRKSAGMVHAAQLLATAGPNSLDSRAAVAMAARVAKLRERGFEFSRRWVWQLTQHGRSHRVVELTLVREVT